MPINVKPSDGPTLEDFLAKLEGVETEADGWVAACPAHDDSHQSLRVTVSEETGKVLVHDRAGCATAKVMRAAGMTMKDLARMKASGDEVRTTDNTEALPDDHALADLAVRLDGYAAALEGPAGAPALAYAAQRFGVEPDDARRLGLGLAVDLGGGPRLVVPFRDLDGRALGFQARALNNVAQVRWAGPANPQGASWAKVGFFPGGSGWPEVIVTEGPGDALTAAATGYDAIGVRGAGLVSNPNTVDQLEEMLEGRIAVVAGDGDVAGRQFSATLASALIERGVEVRVLGLPDGKDITDWRADDPAWFRQGFVKAVKELAPATKESAQLSGWNESTYPLADVGGARYLRDLLDSKGKSIRYTDATGFLQLEGGVWVQLADAQVRTLAHQVGDDLRRYARAARATAVASGQKEDVDRQHRFAAYRDHALSSRGVDALVKELKSVSGVFASIDDFDRHPYYLAVRNGVVDLRTGDLLAHDPALLLTRRVEFDYDPDARADRWRRYLSEVFPDQPEMPGYIQRLVGYGITGMSNERCFVVLYGTGSNGKSVLTETLTEVFRAITVTTPFSTFEAKQNGAIPNDLAALNGSRLVFAPEGEQNKPMAEALLKRITGRDRIAARFLNREFFEFLPTFLLFMSSNYRPAFKGQDEGLWDRVKLIEFRRQFTRAERDKDLGVHLMNEAPGILAWAVQGAVEWYRDGLKEPKTITEVTDTYRTNSDVLAGFLGKGDAVYVRGGEGDWVARTDLFRAFQDYAEEGNFRDLASWSSRAFYRAVEERGFPGRKRNGTAGFAFITKGDGHHEEPEPAAMPVAVSGPLAGPSFQED